MAQHRYTPQPPILPQQHADPRGQQRSDDDWLDAPTEIGMAMPPEVAAVHAEDQRRLASLAALSLNKGPQTMPVAVAVGPRSSSSSSSKLPWVLLTLVLVGGGIYLAAGRERSAPVAPMSTAAVAPMTPTRSGDLVASGYIAAKAPIVLAASSGGRIAELKVDNGDRVKKNQIVAVIADGPLRAELRLANAKLATATTALRRQRSRMRAEAATAADVESAAGAVTVASAEVGMIKQKLEETKIRSTVDGTVLEILARPGEALAVGANGSAGVMRIADLSSLVAEADISEADVRGIVAGQQVEVTTDSQRDRKYKATVREISQQADRSRGTVLVRAYLDENSDEVLKPGMAIQVRFLRDEPTPEPTSGSEVKPNAPAAPSVPTESTGKAAVTATATATATSDEVPAAADKEPAVVKQPVVKTKPKAKPRPKARPRTTKKKKSSGLLNI